MIVFNQKSPTNIEDLISSMAWGQASVFKPDERIISSFDNQIMMGRALTVKQGALALKLCRKYRSQLVTAFGPVADRIIDQEIWGQPLREFTPQTKRIEIVKNFEGSGPHFKNHIRVSFPYDENLVKKIRNFKDDKSGDYAEWHADDKVWMFSLTEGSFSWIGNNLLSQGFSADEKFMEFYEKIQEIFENMEDYAPSMVVENGKPMFKNAHPSVPQPPNEKLLDALFLAKLYGIDVWDEICENYINSPEVSSITKIFLKKDIGAEMTVKAVEHSIDCFDQLLNAINATMIVIPENQELLHLKKWHEHLISLGYTEKDMTVMFRVDNITGKAFNEYIKDHKLNTPISKDLKFVFVSRRIKKPLVKSGIDFGLVISCDPLGSHQSIKRILNDKYNTIVYVDDALPKD